MYTAYAICLQNISLYGIIIFPCILLSRYECRLSFSDCLMTPFHCTLQYIKTIKPTGYTVSMCVYISSFDTVSSLNCNTYWFWKLQNVL